MGRIEFGSRSTDRRSVHLVFWDWKGVERGYFDKVIMARRMLLRYFRPGDGPQVLLLKLQKGARAQGHRAALHARLAYYGRQNFGPEPIQLPHLVIHTTRASRKRSMDTLQMQTYHGNCHCGRYRFRITVHNIMSAVSCSCGLCKKKGSIWLIPSAGSFHVVRDDGSLTEYQSHSLRDKVRHDVMH
jgi:hypothetical protein